MILAAAALVQLGSHGNVPQAAMMTEEELDTRKKIKNNSFFAIDFIHCTVTRHLLLIELNMKVLH